MTVMVTDSSKRFHGSGGTGPFTWTWRFLANADIRVYRIAVPNEADPSQEVRELLVEGDDYTLTGASSYTGGSLTLVAALAVGADLVVERNTEATQDVSIRNQGNNFRPEVHEDVFDHLTMMIQDRDREINDNTADISGLKPRMSGVEGRATALEGRATSLEGRATSLESRAIQVPAGQSAGDMSGTEYASRAGKVLGWNSLGQLALMAMNFVTSSGILGNPWADARGYSSLSDAVTQLGGLSIDLVVYGTHTVTDNLTIPANIRLVVKNGGIIDIAAGKTLTISGTFEAGLYPVFTGTGTVTGLEEATPQWFGAKAEVGVDDTAAIEKAAAASPNLFIPEKRFLCQDATIARRDINIYGTGTLYRTTAGNILKLVGNGASSETCVWPSIRGVTFDGGVPGNGVVGLWLENVREGVFEDISVYGLDKFSVWNGVIGCRFNRIKDLKEDYAAFCNYHFYKDAAVHPNRDADSAITGCSLRANKVHVHLAGSSTVAIDGLTVTDNIFFHWNQSNKTHNIYVSYGYWLNIANNKLFEAGLEAVKLENCIHFVIAGNNIAWPGQRGTGAGAGIRILGNNDRSSINPAYPAYFYNSEGTITGNVISRPTAEGIYISDTIAFSVTGNTIIEPNTYAFGAQITALTPYTKDGIYIDGAASDGSLSGNTVGFDSNLMYRKERSYRWDVFASGGTGNITVNHSPPYEVRTTGNNNTLISDDYEAAGFYTSATGSVNGLPSADNLASSWVFGGTAGPPTYVQNNAVDPTGYNTSAHTLTFPDTVAGTSFFENSISVGSGELHNGTLWMKASADIAVNLGLIIDDANNVGKEDLFHVGGVWRRYKIAYTTGQAGTMKFRVQRKNQAGAVTLYVWRPTLVKGSYEPMAMQKFCMPTMTPYTAYGTSAPVAGWWRVGDRVINSAPTVGQPKAWKCTVAGTPGTWVSEGNL